MIAKKIKEISPDIYVVFGGPQADASAYDTLNELPWVDFCCRGEGETTVFPLFSALLENKDYTKVNGLTYRDSNSGIIENPIAPLIDDLDTLPYIDYSFVTEKAKEYSITNNLSVNLDVGRGCPFNCAYCSTSIFWQRKFRIKSSDRIMKEMLDIYNQFGINNIAFNHDLFTANKKKILKFTEALEKCPVKFNWYCSSRVDTLDEQMISQMAATGLQSVFLGIETGSERMQALINKNLKIADITNTISLLSKYNIKTTASFMYGFPEETEDDLEKTLQLAYTIYKSGVNNFQFHLCTITQGTPYYYKYFDKLTLSTNTSNHVGDFGFEECKDFIKQHIKLFSFCYEYKSELRERFKKLENCAIPAITTYDTLNTFFPESYGNIKISDIVLEMLDIYDENPELHYNGEFAAEYIKRHFKGDTLTKLTDIFKYNTLNDKALTNRNFEPIVETFSTDIQAYKKGEVFENIGFKNQLLYFYKTDGKLHVKCTYL